MKNEHLFNYSLTAEIDKEAAQISQLGGDPRGRESIRSEMYRLEHRQRFERFLLATKDVDEAIALLESYYSAIGEKGEATVQLNTLLK